MNYKILFILLICFGVVKSYSQTQIPKNTPKYDYDPVHFGFTIGLNTMDFTIHNSDDFFSLDTVLSIENYRTVGFNICMVTNFRLAEYFDFRITPGLVFGQRNLTYIRDSAFVIDAPLDESKEAVHVMKIESTFLQVPFTLKYKAKRLNNYRPYLITGLNYCYDLEARKKIKDDEKPKIRLKRNDIYYEIGFGIDYYFPLFKMSSEIKFSVGLMDILQHDSREYSNAIENMNSKMVSLLFHFE
ncbi:MAG: PorT family protein [Bacteroidales bacterium]|nr:PorT family protein [Bacteroidales bacterium]